MGGERYSALPINLGRDRKPYAWSGGRILWIDPHPSEAPELHPSGVLVAKKIAYQSMIA